MKVKKCFAKKTKPLDSILYDFKAEKGLESLQKNRVIILLELDGREPRMH